MTADRPVSGQGPGARRPAPNAGGAAHADGSAGGAGRARHGDEGVAAHPAAADAPGIYTFGHTPRPPDDPDRIPDRRLIGTAVGSLLGMWLVNSSLAAVTCTGCGSGRWSGRGSPRTTATGGLSLRCTGSSLAQHVYAALWWLLLAVLFGRAGHWPEVYRRYLRPAIRRARPARRDVDPARTRPGGRSCGPPARTRRPTGSRPTWRPDGWATSTTPG